MKYRVAKAGHSFAGKRLTPDEDEFTREELGYDAKTNKDTFDALVEARVLVPVKQRKAVSPGNIIKVQPKEAPMALSEADVRELATAEPQPQAKAKKEGK